MRVLDLYAGAGNFSLPLAVHASQIAALEENRHAADDGQRNVKLNNIKIADSLIRRQRNTGFMKNLILCCWILRGPG